MAQGPAMVGEPNGASQLPHITAPSRADRPGSHDVDQYGFDVDKSTLGCKSVGCGGG